MIRFWLWWRQCRRDDRARYYFYRGFEWAAGQLILGEDPVEVRRLATCPIVEFNQGAIRAIEKWERLP